MIVQNYDFKISNGAKTMFRTSNKDYDIALKFLITLDLFDLFNHNENYKFRLNLIKDEIQGLRIHVS